MKGELKKFMDILDGKIDELHEFRQGLSKLGVDNWERGGTESKGSEVRYEGFTTVCLQGRNYVAPPPPEVTSTQKLSALASNKHYHVRKRFVLERESEPGRRKASAPPNGSILYAGILSHTLSLLTRFCGRGGGAALKSWWWVLRFCPSVFFLKAAALLHRQSEFRVEEGTQKG